MRLKRAQVVVDLLTRYSQARGERRGGGGLGQLGEQPTPDRVEGDGRRRRIIDDFHVEHGVILPLTSMQAVTKAIPLSLGLQRGEESWLFTLRRPSKAGDVLLAKLGEHKTGKVCVYI